MFRGPHKHRASGLSCDYLSVWDSIVAGLRASTLTRVPFGSLRLRQSFLLSFLPPLLPSLFWCCLFDLLLILELAPEFQRRRGIPCPCLQRRHGRDGHWRLSHRRHAAHLKGPKRGSLVGIQNPGPEDLAITALVPSAYIVDPADSLVHVRPIPYVRMSGGMPMAHCA